MAGGLQKQKYHFEVWIMNFLSKNIDQWIIITIIIINLWKINSSEALKHSAVITFAIKRGFVN